MPKATENPALVVQVHPPFDNGIPQDRWQQQAADRSDDAMMNRSQPTQVLRAGGLLVRRASTVVILPLRFIVPRSGGVSSNCLGHRGSESFGDREFIRCLNTRASPRNCLYGDVRCMVKLIACPICNRSKWRLRRRAASTFPLRFFSMFRSGARASRSIGDQHILSQATLA